MDVTVSAAEAAARFEDLLQGVRDGRSYTVTEQGRPVAKITAAESERAEGAEARQAAFKQFLDELAQHPALNLPKITRDEMHERD